MGINLITPILGGIIGLFTNWLAIKMLFLPREEKRIFGIKVPLTPGVIPKSKKRMAKTIGNTVGDYLLTEDSIKESLGDNIDEKLNDFIDNIFLNMEDNENRIIDYLEKIPNNNIYIDKFKYNIRNKLKDYLIENKEKIINIFYREINIILDSINLKENGISIIDYLNNNYGESLYYLLEEEMGKIIQSNKRINQYIKEDNINSIKEKISDYIPNIMERISLLLENEAMDTKLLEITKDIVINSFGSIIGSLTYERIYYSLKDGFKKYISEEENNEIIKEKLFIMIDNILDKTPSEITYYFEDTGDIDHIIGGVFNKENYLQIINKLSHSIKNRLEDKSIKEFGEELNIDTEKIVEYIYGEKIEDYILYKIDNVDLLIDYILDFKIKELVKIIGEENLFNIKEIILDNKDILINKGTQWVAKQLDVRSTVEEKINEFDVKEIEEIILDIASKELNYITYMGGVLGFIIGLLPEIVKLI